MIKLVSKGDFTNTFRFLERAKEILKISDLDKYGKQGVEALQAATPVDTGKTRDSWSYDIRHENGSVMIEWTNSNIVDGSNIAVLIQYGHGTRNGGFVVGRDYINPAMRPIFDGIAENVWKEVNKK